MNYYIADLHLGHANVLRFDRRPFKDIAEQDEVITQRWNDRVLPDDDVYILGDISWYNQEVTCEKYQKLNGRKHLIIGNHDRKLIKEDRIRQLFCELDYYREIPFDCANGVVLCHYPILCFNHHLNGWYHFYGHVHNSFEWGFNEHARNEMINKYGKECNMINVGCMMPYMDYAPRTAEEIIDGYNLFLPHLDEYIRCSK